MKAYSKNIPISPKKLRVIAEVVRDMDTVPALDILKFMPKKGAQMVYKTLQSAIANAVHNDVQDLQTLKIGTIIINQGIVHKRGKFVGRWRHHRILKRTSNVTITLESK